MMTVLLEKTGLVLWVVIFAFVGLIVVEWGADYSGGGQVDVGDDVGVINGQRIGLREFQSALRNMARQVPQEQRADQGRLVREVWDGYIRDILLMQEIKRVRGVAHLILTLILLTAYCLALVLFHYLGLLTL